MSRTVPPFETPDEPFHYAFARHIAAGNWLPVQRPDEEQPWSHEGSQAPLYYLLTGWLTAPIDQSDYPNLAIRNPRANMGNPLLPGNKNFMLYSGVTHPLSGANLALHIGRWFSLLLAAITLWFTWLTARIALPNSPKHQLAVLLFAASIPQFVFVSASFSNDNMVTAAATVTVYLLLRIVDQIAHHQPVKHWQWLLLGGLLGVAALSKLSGLGLSILAAVAVWVIAIHKREWRLPWRSLPLIGIPFLLVAGWWYWRNYTLYGDWLGANYLLEINGQRSEALTWSSLWSEFRGLRYSFWGLFGWFNIPLPNWSYSGFDWLSLIALVGLSGTMIGRSFSFSSANDSPAASTRGRKHRIGHANPTAANPTFINGPAVMTLGLWAIIPLGLILYWAQQATSSQGRLLFPALSALAILFIIGLDFWWQLLAPRLPNAIRRLQWGGLLAPSLLSLACTLYALALLIPQSYRVADPLIQLPSTVDSREIRFGDASQGETEFTLLGLTVGEASPAEGSPQPNRYRVADSVPVTLYLRAEEQPKADHQLFIQLLDEDGSAIANLTTHPGWGRSPTTTWQPGLIYADSYQVPIDGPIDPKSPLLAKVYVGIIDPTTEQTGRQPLSARDENGEPSLSMPATVVIEPRQPINIGDFDSYTALNSPGIFGHMIELTGVIVPQSIEPSTPTEIAISLWWTALAEPGEDYVAYVHLLNHSGERVAGFDQPPAGSRLPTRYWQPADQIQTEFRLSLPEDLPAGQYEMRVGLYEEGSQGSERLAVTESGSLQMAHNQLLLGNLEIR